MPNELVQGGRASAASWNPASDPLSGSKALVVGLARQGTASAEFLVRVASRVTVTDLRDASALAEPLRRLHGLPITYVLGNHPPELLDEADLVCLSAGVPVDAPLVREAIRRNITLTNDAQLFLERCPACVVGITGSAGKTTTTALVAKMARAAGLATWVGGNIGNPLLGELAHIQPDDRVIMELSSFQLETMTVSPSVAGLLNITPNHLDRHRTMEAYIAAKRTILAHQLPTDTAVLGLDDGNVRSLAAGARARLRWFSLREEVEDGAFGTDERLTLRTQGVEDVICSHSDVRLLGRHNLLNMLASCALARLIGTPVEAIRQVATTFRGVEHRLELVAEIRGARWYNDSIATAPERSLAAIRAFDCPIVLLAGGRDKDLLWDEFAVEVTRRVRHVVTFGEAGPLIASLLAVPGQSSSRAGQAEGVALESVIEANTLEEAVSTAACLARPGDVVLLSPGGTSFDAFQDFAERGARFRELVSNL